VEIDIILGLAGGNYLISVHDFDVMVGEAGQPKLFTKFYRGVEAQKIKTVGSGLGLYIAKSCIELNGGNI